MIFLFPGRLWFLLLLLIPLIIHLFDFRKTIKTYFPHIRILRELTEKTKREQTLRRWILFAIRFFAYAFIILAFCMPVRENEISNISGGDKLLIALDNSMSMKYQSGQYTLLQQAKNLAKEAIDKQSASTLIGIMPLSSSLKPDFHLKNETSKYLDSIFYHPFYINQYKTIINTFNSSQAKSIILFSDFQKSDFPVEFFNLLDSINANIYLMPINVPKISNISIDSIFLASPVVVRNSQGTLYIKLKNRSDVVEEGVKIEISLNKKSVGSVVTNLPANTQTTEEINFWIGEDKYITGQATIVDNGYDFDNNLFFSINIPSKISVYHSYENNYRSLIPNIFIGDSLFNYQKVNVNALSNSKDLSAFYILESLDNISPDVFNSLLGKVSEGSSIFIIPPEKNPKYLNSLLSGIGIAISDALDMQALRIEKISFSLPFFKGMFTSPPRDYDYPRVNKYYHISAPNAYNLLSLTNGDPYLQQIKYGKGNIYIIASPLQSDITSLVQHQLFVPLLLQMAFSSTQAMDLYYFTNQSIGIALPIMLNGAGDLLENKESIYLIDPVNDIRYIPYITGGEQTMLFFNNAIRRADIYDLYVKDQKIPIAFNYPRNESDPMCWSKSELDSIVKNLSNIYVGKYPIAFGETNYIHNTIKMPLWQILIILTLVLLIIEIILLRLWGNRV
jgi:hypothetical protein